MATGWTSTHQGRHLAGRRKTGTTPELLLRKELHARGARFRLHRQLAKGCTPDILLPGRRLVVFVDGDYWHSCPVHGRRSPFTGPNAALWEQKTTRNRQRDQRSTELAQDAGWTVVRMWECTIRHNPGAAATAVLEGRCLPPTDMSTQPSGGPTADEVHPLTSHLGRRQATDPMTRAAAAPRPPR